MMAVRAPLGLSPSSNPLFSAFSPFSEHPESPRPASASGARSTMSSLHRESGLRASFGPSSSVNPSPSSAVNPSPIYSEAGTEFVDVDEEVVEEEEPAPVKTPPQQLAQPIQTVQRFQPVQPPQPVQPVPLPNLQSSPPQPKAGGLTQRTNRTKLSLTTIFNAPNQSDDIEPLSVIHAPTGFGKFDKTQEGSKPQVSNQANQGRRAEPAGGKQSPPQHRQSTSSDTERARADSADSLKSDTTVTMNIDAGPLQSNKQPHEIPIPPTPLQTKLPYGQDWSTTPRAQTRSDLGSLSRPGSSLDSIQEGDDIREYSGESGEENEDYRPGLHIRSAEDEVAALRSALSECWTLCNTLAGLSYVHRQKMFDVSGAGDMQQTAWKSCWKLCQNLYDTQEGRLHASARPTLDLCREFCAALFDVRVRDNETADSVLRVSFELNNHLFNTHDRNLPEAFRERTLDFYITLCHRLMKQKARIAQETDSLLRACWSLAEMLFNLRQNKRENRKPDEELLGSAVQACWELCDLFREGWTQIRPERGTPRPSQPTFTQAYNQAKRAGFAPLDEHGNPKPLPETPTTLFEETLNMISPDDPPPAPNILVLGQPGERSNSSASLSQQSAPQRESMSAQPGHRRQWPSITSQAQSQSQTQSAASDVFNPVSAASTVTQKVGPNQSQSQSREDKALTLLRILFIRAAIVTNRGYTRTSADPNLNSLVSFVRNLPETAFGTQVWQMSLLENYQKAVASDSNFRNNLGLAMAHTEKGQPVNPVDVARAVKGMTSCVYGFGWLRDLYRFVFGYYVDEALKGEDGDGSDGGRGKRNSGDAAGPKRMHQLRSSSVGQP